MVKKLLSIGVLFPFHASDVCRTATDSIYGSRHLAAQMEQDGSLEKINLFVLLDLIGASAPAFYGWLACSFYRGV